jgi:chemotaxis protein CheD
LGLKYVGIGELAVSKTPGDIIKTMALGSCIGIVVYDTTISAAGLLHIALPDSSVDRARGQKRPARYADTGIPLLVKKLKGLGSKADRNLMVKIAGGAQIMDPNDTFNVGKRNILAAKKILWKNNLLLKAEDVGGSISRTVAINVNDGTTIITSPGRMKKEL